MFTKKTRVISAIATVCMLISMFACIAVPAHAVDEVDPSTYASVTTVTAAITPDTTANYSINSVADWEYVANHIDWFNDDDIVLHLTTNLDMSSSSFIVMDDPYFSVDGHNHTFENWGTAAAPVRSNGIFRYNSNDGQMKFIKNFNIDNCHTKYNEGASSCSALLVSFEGGNRGQTGAAAEFTIENVHISNSSVVGIGAQNSIFISGYATNREDYTLNIKNCSLVGTTLTAGTGGHAGMLIGKLSDNDNGRNGTINVSNIYFKGNTYHAGRTTSAYYDNMFIGNVEGGNVALTVNNVFIDDNTANYKSPIVGYVMISSGGTGGAHRPNLSGIVIQDNTLNTSATETQRGVIALVNGSINSIKDVYTNDTAIAYDGVSIVGAAPIALTAKVNDSYMTSGEAAYALNKNASADTAFWYTTTAEGVARGTAANATRKVDLYVNGEVANTYYANVDAGVTVSYEGATSYAIMEGSAGSVDASTGAVTFGGNNDVAVVVTLGDAAAKAEAKAALEESIAYFTARNIDYYVAAAATALSDAQAVLADDASDTEDYQNAKAALDAFKTQYVGKDNAPSTSEIDKYPNAPAYAIREAADFQALEDKKNVFTENDTVYMAADVDMRDSSFDGINDFKASFDGQGHKIKNWGTVTNGDKLDVSAKNTRGLFTTSNNGTALIKSIKNVTFVNCHTTSGSSYSSMLYGVSHSNGGLNAASGTTLTFENVHFDGCSMTATGGECFGFLLSRYAVQTKEATVNMTNCSIINSTMNGANFGHIGLLMGKLRGNGTQATIHNFKDCYLAGNTYNTTRTWQVSDGNSDNGNEDYSNYVGLIFGTAEGGASYTKVNLNNVGAVDNTINATSYINLLGCTQSSTIEGNGVILTGNEVVGENVSVYMVNSSSAHSVNKFYCDTALTKVSSHNNDMTITGTTVGAEAAWNVNTVSNGNLYWTTTEGAVEKGTEANATRRVTLELDNGNVVKTYYANRDTTVEIAYDEEPSAEFAIKDGSTGSISGNTVSFTANADVVVAVSLDEAQELANAKASLQEAINYFKVDRNLDYFTNAVKTAVAEAEELYASSNDKAAIQAKKDALMALDGNYVDTYPNVPSISEMSKYNGTHKNYKIMSGDEMVTAEATAALYADGITLHLGADINLAGKSFTDFNGASFDFDGHEKTISNWTNNNTVGMFANYKGGTIKNFTIQNVDIGGGYGRAVFCGNGTTGDTTIENVHVKDAIVAENSQGNLAGIFFGQLPNGNVATIRNCSVVTAEIKSNLTGANYGITNSGVVCGRAAHGSTYNVENLYVDGFINNGNSNESSDGNGILFGTVENPGVDIDVDGVIIVNCGGAFASLTVDKAMTTAATISIKNLLAANNDVKAVYGATTTADVTFQNVYTDETNKVLTLNANGVITATATEFAGITQMDATAFKNGEAAWTLNNGAGKLLAYVDDSFDAYPVLGAKTGYGAPLCVDFVDAANENALVASYITNGSGKLPAAAAETLDNAAYDWKLNGADVSINDTFAQSATVTSNVTHTYEGTPEPIEGTNTHKVPCTDDGCEAYKIVDCADHTKTHKGVVENVHVHEVACVCGRVLRTDACTINITAAEGDIHAEACEECDYEDANVACVYTGWAHDITTAKADAMHIGTCTCGDTKSASCNFDDGVEVTPADFGVCGETKFTCEDCGYFYSVYSAMKSNAKLTITTEPVYVEESIFVTINLVPDENGIADVDFDLTFDAEKLTFVEGTAATGFNLVEYDDSVDGVVNVKAANDTNITGEVGIIVLEFAPVAEAGTFEIEVEVNEADIVNAEDETRPISVAGATGVVLVKAEEYTPGDVNEDGVISIADAVLVLRVLSGKLNADLINVEAANVYTDDGITENNGLTTADAKTILELVLAQY